VLEKDVPDITQTAAPDLQKNLALTKNAPFSLPDLQIIYSQNGVAYVLVADEGNYYVLRIGSRRLNNIIHDFAYKSGKRVKKDELNAINEYLTARAEASGVVKNVYSRVAPIGGGIEVDLCDVRNTRIRVTAGKVETIEQGSNTLFFRNPVSRAMVMPASEGDLDLLKRYVNLSATDYLLFIAWLSYTLAHPKITSSKYVMLVLQGDQGSGKSFACQSLIIPLLDPNSVGLQMFPQNIKDLAIASQNAHVLCFDNMRNFRATMSDYLCIASTGGNISSRALYTDSDQHVHSLHVPLVMNGIHSLINQSDLAQRCLILHTKTLPKSDRKSEAVMISELEADMPAIFRGLLELIADVFKHLPDAEITDPERMIDFVYWLAAMEKADGVPLGIYQSLYSSVLHDSQLDALLENLLAATIYEFTQDYMQGDEWSGTPAELLEVLENVVTYGAEKSSDWPRNSIALSKRLRSLKASLLEQGISIELIRYRHTALPGWCVVSLDAED